MKQRRFFGTDGIRGRVGCFPITPEFMVKLGWAVGTALAAQTGAKVVIGKDTRLSGYMLEYALASGLNAAGVEVLFVGPMPTPAVAYITRTFHAQLGIVISASHNPYYDNGIKFFSSDGMKLPDEVELQIESLLEQDLETVSPEWVGHSNRINDAPGRYIEFCKSSVPHFLTLESLKIAIDCAHGATYHIAPRVFEELGATVVAIGVEPNGLNINEGVGSTHPEKLQALVQAEGADVGIAFDGDGDRVVMVDQTGELIDGDDILYVIAREAQREGLLNGRGVVGTQMSNYGLELALDKAGIPFVRSKVGDRYVMETLEEKGWLLGGESSGHIIWRDSQTTGDGIVSALQILAIMKNTGKSLHELLSEMEKYPQVMINVPVAQLLNKKQNSELAQLSEAETQKLAGQGRVLLRSSGTEPLIRVMVEGGDPQKVQTLAESLSQYIKGRYS